MECKKNIGDYILEWELEDEAKLMNTIKFYVFFKKNGGKIVILRIVVGDLILNQNLNMALSHYGLNLKELKIKIDSLVEQLPKGMILYFNFVLYKNGSYDIFIKGPTLSNSISNILTQEVILESYKLSIDDLILFLNFRIFICSILNSYNLFFFKNLYSEYKQLLGIISSFKTS